jgi:hypothetical protein
VFCKVSGLPFINRSYPVLLSPHGYVIIAPQFVVSGKGVTTQQSPGPGLRGI